jgi:hypothetical protein
VTVFTLNGTDRQNAVVQAAIDVCDFPWHRLVPGLETTVQRATIPVDWDDLSRYGQARGHGSADHDELPFHPLEARGRVLGLAWYAGRVTLDTSLEADPTLAGEVFLSEAAHMADFFYLTDEQRSRIFALYHGWDPYDPTSWQEHPEHGWFDVSTYRDWVGESLMGGFVQAFSPLPVTIRFSHELDAAGAKELRRIMLDQPWLFGVHGSEVFHDEHRRVPRDVEWPTRAAAVADGRRPCRVCRP